MRIHTHKRDGIAFAEGHAKDVYELLGLLIANRVQRITTCVYGTGMSITWGL
jgi:hypothetical protein